jgi:toxin FitB
MATAPATEPAHAEGSALGFGAEVWQPDSATAAPQTSQSAGVQVTSYLLDTNVISELRKPKPHRGATAWLRGLMDSQLFLSAVTFGELQRGIERTRVHDPDKAAEIERWADQLASSYQVLTMDAKCFREWARLMEGKSNTLFEDGMIAATARVHGLTVATRNGRDFKELNVPIFDPFGSTI